MSREQGSRGTYVVAIFILLAVAATTWFLLIRQGDIRLLMSGAMVGVLVVAAVVRPRGMMVLILASLPLLGLVRRVFDVLAREPMDPLLAIVPVVTVALSLVAFHTNRGSIGRSFAESGLTRATSVLAAIFVLEIFNPLQGGVFVGLAGTLFLLVPLLWYFLGRTHFDEATVERVLGWTLVLGVACGFYGIWQSIFGFNAIDQAWIYEREPVFQSLRVGRFVRSISTFPSPEEWSRYMMVSGTVAFGFLASKSRWRALAGVCFAVSITSLLLCAIRVSVIGFLVSLGVLMVGGARSRTAAMARIALLVGALVAFLVIVPALSIEEMVASDRAMDSFFGHTSRGLRTPLEEGSFQARLELWQKLMLDFVPSHPLGMGLGGSTLGGARVSGGVYIITESFAVTVFVAAGIIGGGLFLLVIALATRECVRMFSRSPSSVNAIVGAVTVGILFTSLTGNSLSLYSVGPLGWALIGYLSTLRSAGPRTKELPVSRPQVALVTR